MKKIVAMAMAAMMAVSMTACGSGNDTTTTAAPGTTAAEATTAAEGTTAAEATTAAGTTTAAAGTTAAGGAAATDYTFDLANVNEQAWTLGTDSVEDAVTHLFAKEFERLLEEYSEGKIDLEVYPNAQIGNDKSLLESVKAQDGGANFLVQTTAPEVAFMPKLAVFDIPCAFATIDEFRAAIDNQAFMDQVDAVYNEGGYKLLGFADQGFRVMTANKEIKTIDDFSGIKIRTMDNKYHMAFWTAIGANPTPMTFSEVYTSLQTKALDAQENPYEVVAGSKFYEVQSHVINTNHVPHTLALITGTALWDTLNEDEQNLVMKAASEAKVYARQQADDRVDQRVEVITGGGATIVDLSEELRQQMIEKSQGVYEEIKGVVGDDLYNAYLGK